MAYFLNPTQVPTEPSTESPAAQALGASMTDATPGSKAWFLCIFFLSGFSSLIYQVVWQKALTQIIGVDHFSTVLIVSLFMLGLGLGGAAGALVARAGWNATRTYALVEATLAVFGLFSLTLLREVNARFLAGGGGYVGDFIVNAAFLLLPTVLMGMTLPLMLHAFRGTYPAGKAVGVVYSANILGACAGVLISGFLLMGSFGMTATCSVAAAINGLLAAVVFCSAGKSCQALDPTPLVIRPSTRPRAFGTWRWVLASFASGFVALSYEIICFRMFTAYFGGTAYVFPILIFSYLAMMAAGNYVFGRRADLVSIQKQFILIASMTIVTTLGILWGQELMHWVGVRQNHLVMWPFRTWLAYAQIIPILLISALLMTPVAFISGLFPVLAREITTDAEDLAPRTGWLYLVQTTGNFSGTLVTGLVLLPAFGTVGSLKVLAAVLGLLALLACWPDLRMHFATRTSLCMGALAGAAVLLYPGEFYSTVRYYQESDTSDVQRPIIVKESAFGATLTYLSDGKMQVYVGRLFSNSFRIKPDKLEGVDACFPMDWIAAIKGLDVKRALYIGTGSGTGLFCLRKIFPGVEIDTVEINPELIELMEEHSADAVRESLAAARVHIADGRRHVQRHPEDRYDLIHVGVFNAWCAGCGNVFTTEFLRLLGERLTPRGVVTYNAYPAAVKSGLMAFRDVVVLSPGPSRISEVCASNGLELSRESAFDTRIFLENMIRLESESGEGTVRINRGYLREGAVIPRDIVGQMVEQIAESTDDLPVTEYFLNQNQFTYPVDWLRTKPEKDMRIFECPDCPRPLAAVAGESGTR